MNKPSFANHFFLQKASPKKLNTAILWKGFLIASQYIKTNIMEANSILQASLLDIVFEGRNKDYGAYALRKKYNGRVALALGITGAIALLAVGGNLLAEQLKPKEISELKITEIVVADIKPPEEKIQPPPPLKVPPPPKVQSIKLTIPDIRKDEEVKETEMPPIDELENAKISNVTQTGINDLDIAVPPTPPVDEKKVVEEPKEDPNQPFNKVEIPAEVDKKQWERHLKTHLMRYIEAAADQGMEPGVYTVQVRFLVERDGSITEAQALTDPGFGLAKGAREVIIKGPKWRPGIQNGKPVRSYHTQPISFQLQGDN